MSGYHEFQSRFARALKSAEASPSAARELFSGPPLQAEDALAIYRNNYFHGFIRAARDACPVVAQLVGEDFFKSAARAFILAHPPQARSLSCFGEGFGTFLESFEPAKSVPYLGDVARLEHARLEALNAASPDSAPSESLDPRMLRGMTAEHLYDLRLVLHPSARLLDLDWPADAIWQAHQPPAALDGLQIEPERIHLLILRRDGGIVQERLSLGLAALVRMVAEGAALGEAAQQAIEAAPGDLDAIMRRALDLRVFKNIEEGKSDE